MNGDRNKNRSGLRLLHQSRNQALQSPFPPQHPPKPLNHEFVKAKQLIHSGWEQQTILSILNDPNVKGFVYDLNHSGQLILITVDPDQQVADNVAAETDAILAWLGAKNLKVYLWYRDDPRTLDANEWPTRKNVNGGWATPGQPEIVIYRQEEWQRVLIHETIHAMKWDWPIGPTPQPCWKLNNSDKLMPHLFEAWTELYAEWLLSAWNHVSWEDQRKWQDFQATQLLARAKHTWQEDTNVWAYYVLKAALAPHIEFLWMAGSGQTPEEQSYTLCTLVGPELERLRHQAKTTTLVPMSLRMSLPPKVGKK